MSMSTHVVGFCDPTEDYLKKLKVWEALLDADIDPEEWPDELADMFDGHTIEHLRLGIEVNIDHAITKQNAFGESGYVLEIAKLPKHVTKIKFSNSY